MKNMGEYHPAPASSFIYGMYGLTASNDPRHILFFLSMICFLVFLFLLRKNKVNFRLIWINFLYELQEIKDVLIFIFEGLVDYLLWWFHMYSIVLIELFILLIKVCIFLLNIGDNNVFRFRHWFSRWFARTFGYRLLWDPADAESRRKFIIITTIIICFLLGFIHGEYKYYNL